MHRVAAAVGVLAVAAALRARSVGLRFVTSASAAASSVLSTGRNVLILEYTYVPNIVERRAPYRPQHLQLAKDYKASGKLLNGGPLSPPTGAVFLFEATREEVEKFVKADPYVVNGLVPSWEVKEWSVLV